MMSNGKCFWKGAVATGVSLKYKIGWLLGFILREKTTSVACFLGSGVTGN